MSQMAVVDANGNQQLIAQVANTGQTTGSQSFPVVMASDFGWSNGSDFSANTPALPNVAAATFGGTSIYAAYTLVATVPANSARHYVEIANLSGQAIVIIRDDGTANSGAAPVNASLIEIQAGAGAGLQGGSWTSSTFRGRLQIYAAAGSTAQVACMVD